MKHPLIQARVVMDSISQRGERVLTIILKAPKSFDAEFEKHGNIASNASSSRSMSFPANSRGGVFIPNDIREPAKGMNNEERVDDATKHDFISTLASLHDYTVDALIPYKYRIHKQHLNRYIEAFTMQTKVATANLYAWRNFLYLRLANDADPAMRQLAEVIDEAIKTSVPVIRTSHIPFSDDPLVSAGRIARVSYDNVDKPEDAEKAYLRAIKLRDSGHKTPFEHQIFFDECTPTEFMDNPDRRIAEGWTHTDGLYVYSGRIRGGTQLRKTIWNSLQEVKL